MTPQEQKRRYLWQCRRGMKEVEIVLNGYLERFFDGDDEAQRFQFGRLLECHDADMLEWFMGRGEPEDAALREFVRDLLGRLAT
jgi:antitoxin CptB